MVMPNGSCGGIGSTPAESVDRTVECAVGHAVIAANDDQYRLFARAQYSHIVGGGAGGDRHA